MSEEVVSIEQATKEVNEWLDFMDSVKIDREKESVKIAIDLIINAVKTGELSIDGSTITQTLKTPLGDGATKEIVYDFRFNIGDYNKVTKALNSDNFIDKVIAKLTLISKAKHPKGVFERLERHDYLIAERLTIFF